MIEWFVNLSVGDKIAVVGIVVTIISIVLVVVGWALGTIQVAIPGKGQSCYRCLTGRKQRPKEVGHF